VNKDAELLLAVVRRLDVMKKEIMDELQDVKRRVHKIELFYWRAVGAGATITVVISFLSKFILGK
jgi:hypothetical protein